MRYALPLVPGKALRSVGMGIRMNRGGVEAAAPAIAEPTQWATLLLDTFGGSDALPDHVADTGQTTIDDPSFFGASNPADWSTQGGWLGTDVDSLFALLYDVDFGVQDQFVNARLRGTSDSAGYIAIGARYEEGGFGYTVELNALNPDNTLVLDLWRYAPGGTQLLATTDQVAIDPAGFEITLITCNAQQIVQIDGVTRANAADEAVTIVGRPLLLLQSADAGQREAFGIDHYRAGAFST